MSSEAEFLDILCTCIQYNLRSCHLRLTLGRAPLCIHIILTERRSQVRPSSSYLIQGSLRDVVYLSWPKAPSYLSPNKGGWGWGVTNFLLNLWFEQHDPWTEPQLNLRWIWVCSAVILEIPFIQCSKVCVITLLTLCLISCIGICTFLSIILFSVWHIFVAKYLFCTV